MQITGLENITGNKDARDTRERDRVLHKTHLFLHRLTLLVIGGQVDEDRALEGTVECQVRVGTWTRKRNTIMSWGGGKGH